MKIISRFFMLVVSAILISTTHVQAAISPTAPTIYLQTSCDNGSGGTIDNCFTDETIMMNWIKDTRNPNPASPLTVEIGPGTYQRIEWLCTANQGYTSFRGAGRGRTVFTDSNVLGNAMTFQNCKDMTFDSMTINARFISVIWAGSGNANWQDVELVGEYAAWYETPAGQLSSGSVCPSGVNNEHKFFSSSLIVKNSTIGSFIYLNNCGVTWFYGSELIFDGTTATYTGVPWGVISKGEGHEVHLYGSNIRLFAGINSSVSGLIAYESRDGAQIHSHGTGIDVISEKAIDVTALKALNGGIIHAAESAYVLRTASGGTVTRINNNAGMIHAPHFWSHVPNTDGNPSTIDTNFISTNGSDQTIVTSNTSDGFPHMAIYSTGCPSSSRWYDTIDQVCRNQ